MRYRSAVTGRYVSEYYAKRHPKTTVKEEGDAGPQTREHPEEQIERLREDQAEARED